MQFSPMRATPVTGIQLMPQYIERILHVLFSLNRYTVPPKYQQIQGFVVQKFNGQRLKKYVTGHTSTLE